MSKYQNRFWDKLTDLDRWFLLDKNQIRRVIKCLGQLKMRRNTKKG